MPSGFDMPFATARGYSTTRRCAKRRKILVQFCPVFKRKFLRFLAMLIKLILLLAGLALLLLLSARLATGAYARPRTYTKADVPARKVAIVFGAGLWRDGTATPVLRDRVALRGTIYPGNWEFNVRAIYDGRDETTITRQFYFHYDYLNEFVKQRFPRSANNAGTFAIEVDDAGRVADVARAIDAEFANSLAATLTETEKAFQLSFVAMIETIVQVISGVSYIVILIIFAVAANTMAMTARERLAEYATLKALGFGPGFVARLIFSESMLIALIGAAAALLLTPVLAAGFFDTVGKSIFARFQVAPSTYALQVVAAAAVGVLAALVPMVRSARVKIVDGLRHVG